MFLPGEREFSVLSRERLAQVTDQPQFLEYSGVISVSTDCPGCRFRLRRFGPIFRDDCTLGERHLPGCIPPALQSDKLRVIAKDGSLESKDRRTQRCRWEESRQNIGTILSMRTDHQMPF